MDKRLETKKGPVHCRTPFDTYLDEMDYDQKVLAKAADAISQWRSATKSPCRVT